MASADDIIKVAEKEIGTKENPPDSNKVKYNTWLYGREVRDGVPAGSSYPWCAAFVSWVFYQVDASLIKKSASCMEIANWFKEHGQWKSGSPKRGDVVFFRFGTNSRWTNHVGIVESVNKDGSINTIEGNTSRTDDDNGGCVMARVRRSNIVGYGVPKYNYHSIYFEAYTGASNSFVDGLHAIGANYSFAYRKNIAFANGFEKYNADAEQNTYLLLLLKKGKLKKP